MAGRYLASVAIHRWFVLLRNSLFFCTALAVCPWVATPTQLRGRNAPKLSDYVGTWVHKFDSKNVLVLTLKLANNQLSGTTAMPSHFQIGQGGEFSHISSTPREKPILETSFVEGNLRIKAGTASDVDEFTFSLVDHAHALFQLGFESSLLQVPPWKLERVSEAEKATVATNWDTTEFPKDIVALQAELKEMVEEDQAVRGEIPMLESKLTQVDDKHYPKILRIYEKYKWPLISVVGGEAAHNYWLLVQHQGAAFQQRVLPDLRWAVESGEASKVDYAYLYDRVMVNQGKPQHWGPQADCKDKKAVLSPVDDLAGLEQRRKELHLMPVAVDEYLKSLDSRCSNYVKDAPTAIMPLL